MPVGLSTARPVSCISADTSCFTDTCLSDLGILTHPFNNYSCRLVAEGWESAAGRDRQSSNTGIDKLVKEGPAISNNPTKSQELGQEL